MSVWNLCALSSSTSESTGFTSSSGKGTTYESCEAMSLLTLYFFIFFRGNPKITHLIKTRVFACKLCAHFYLAIFGFRRVAAAELEEVALCSWSRHCFERYYGNVATCCLKTSRGRGDRREDSRQKLSRKSFSIGDFLCGKNIFCLKKDWYFHAFMPQCRAVVRRIINVFQFISNII